MGCRRCRSRSGPWRAGRPAASSSRCPTTPRRTRTCRPHTRRSAGSRARSGTRRRLPAQWWSPAPTPGPGASAVAAWPSAHPPPHPPRNPARTVLAAFTREDGGLLSLPSLLPTPGARERPRRSRIARLARMGASHVDEARKRCVYVGADGREVMSCGRVADALAAEVQPPRAGIPPRIPRLGAGLPEALLAVRRVRRGSSSRTPAPARC